MKSLILVSSLAAMPVFSAQPELVDMKIQCFNTKEFVEVVTTKHGEMPMTLGKSEKDMNTVVWLNQKTMAYTITMSIPSEGKTCVIDSGTNFGPFNKTQKSQSKATS